MKLYYPAIFEEENNSINVTFPDLPEVITCGETVVQAVEKAKECLGLCLEVKKENHEKFPKSTLPLEIKRNKNSFIMMIEYDSIEFNKKYNNKAVRKNVTIPAWLAQIAEENNVNFSNVLQNALIKMFDL